MDQFYYSEQSEIVLWKQQRKISVTYIRCFDKQTAVMYSFEGDFRRKPVQSLGGASKHQQRDILLQRAQIERQKREVCSKQTTIQCFLSAKSVKSNRNLGDRTTVPPSSSPFSEDGGLGFFRNKISARNLKLYSSITSTRLPSTSSNPLWTAWNFSLTHLKMWTNWFGCPSLLLRTRQISCMNVSRTDPMYSVWLIFWTWLSISYPTPLCLFLIRVKNL